MRNPYKDFSEVNPQRENGHREIENSVFQAIMRADLYVREFKILLCIIDKTWGFNKTEDDISLSQFMNSTLLDKRSVVRALQSLEKKHLIVIQRSGPGRGRGNTYMFNKHWDTWVLKMGAQAHQLASNGGTGAPIEGKGAQAHQLASNGGTGAPIEGKGAQAHQLASNGGTGAPIKEEEKGAQAHHLGTIKGGEFARKGGTDGIEKGAQAHPQKKLKKYNKRNNSSSKESEKRQQLLLPSTPNGFYYLEQTGKKRFGSEVQKRDFEDCEEKVSPIVMRKAIDWALKNEVSFTKMISAAQTMSEGGQDGRSRVSRRGGPQRSGEKRASGSEQEDERFPETGPGRREPRVEPIVVNLGEDED